jgi:spermidine/putrescine transport system permease protein
MSAAPAPGTAPQTSFDDVARPVGAHRWTPYALLAPGMLWLAIFFIVPTITLVYLSLSSGNVFNTVELPFTWEFDNYWSVVEEYVIDEPVFQKSLLFAMLATLICLAVSYPLAYTIAFKAGRWKNLLLVLVIAPFFTSFLLRTNAWSTILADGGFVVDFMKNTGMLTVLHAIHTPESWPSWLQILPDGLTGEDRVTQTPLAVILGLAYNFLPFMTLPLYASLERLDIRLIEAATDLYSSAITAFRKVTFPLSLPGVVAGTLLTFIPAAGDPVNSELLGATNDAMVGNVIDSQRGIGDYPIAAAMSVILMFTIVVLVALYVKRAGTEELV